MRQARLQRDEIWFFLPGKELRAVGLRATLLCGFAAQPAEFPAQHECDDAADQQGANPSHQNDVISARRLAAIVEVNPHYRLVGCACEIGNLHVRGQR